MTSGKLYSQPEKARVQTSSGKTKDETDLNRKIHGWLKFGVKGGTVKGSLVPSPTPHHWISASPSPPEKSRDNSLKRVKQMVFHRRSVDLLCGGVPFTDDRGIEWMHEYLIVNGETSSPSTLCISAPRTLIFQAGVWKMLSWETNQYKGKTYFPLANLKSLSLILESTRFWKKRMLSFRRFHRLTEIM